MADDDEIKPRQQPKGGGKPPPKQEGTMILGVRFGNFAFLLLVGTLVLSLLRFISWLF